MKKRQNKTLAYSSTASERVIYYCDKVVEWGLYALVFLVPLVFCKLAYQQFELIKMVLTQLIALVVSIAWIIKAVEKREFNWVRTSLFIPITAFLGVCIVSTLNSVSILTSLHGKYRLNQGLWVIFAYVLIYFVLINNIKGQHQIRKLVICALSAGASVATYGISQRLGFDPLLGGLTISGTERNFSTLGNPIFLGGYLVMLIPVGIAMLVGYTSKWGRLLTGIVVVLMYMSLIFTYSRGAWLGFLGSMIVLGLLLNKKVTMESGRWLLSLAVILVLLTLILSFQKVSARKERVNLIDRAVSIADRRESAIAARICIWKSALHIIKDHPFLGTGLDTFGIVYPEYQSIKHIEFEGILATAGKAHNCFLQIAVTMGLLGLFTYLWVLIVFLRRSLSLLRTTKDRLLLLTVISLLAGGVAYLVQNQFSFDVITTGLMFWFFLGLMDAAGMVERLELKGSGDRVEVARGNRISMKRGKHKTVNREKPSNITKVVIYSLLTGIAIFATIKISQPLVADMYYKKGLAYIGTQENTKKAIPFLKRAVALNSAVEEYHFKLGYCFSKELNWNKTEKEYKKAVALKPNNPNARFNLGMTYYHKGRFNKAIAEFKKASRILKVQDPKDAEVYYWLGNACSHSEEYDSAITTYKKAIKLKPDFAHAHINLGYAYYMKGRIKEAVFEYRKAASLEPDSEIGKLARKNLIRLGVKD